MSRLSEQQHRVLDCAARDAKLRVQLHNRHVIKTANSLETMGFGKVYWDAYCRYFGINAAGQKALEAYR